MIYFRVVRRWWAVPLAVGLLCALCWAAGGTEVPVPTLLGGMAGTRVAYFAPLIVVVTVLYCLERRVGAAEGTAVVPVRRLDHGALLATLVLVHLAGLAVGMDVPRNLMMLLALALVVRHYANEAAAGGACLALLLTTAVIGRVHDGTGYASARWWALPLHPAGSVATWLAALLLLSGALLATGRPRHGVPGG
ncbi:hypothetical protein [Streptomyces sp. NPDC086023]|uniref:hypothetical protein n=1 Tax=Streptomyces sp. NPDC086023 TaxID=3365746 RepID=UPI0037D4DD0F